MLAYLAAGAMLLSIWIVLFLRRKDLRHKMVVLSLITIPLGVFDYLSQPGYWHPPTFFDLPVGIEGCIAGFCIGGIGAVLYQGLTDKHMQKLTNHGLPIAARLAVPLEVVCTSLLLHWVAGFNMMHSLPIGIGVGLLTMAFLRPDLGRHMVLSSVTFGALYFLIFFVWLLIFPHAISWWNLELYGNWTTLGVPLGEVIFGFLYGAFWGLIYEFVFGYRIVARSR